VKAWLVCVLLVFGAGWMLIAALGVLRMPDLFSRMQSSSKAGTLGIGATMLAVAIHFGDVAAGSRAALIIGFFFLTAPVAAHMIARAAYLTGVPRWVSKERDELGAALQQAPPAPSGTPPERGPDA
jgi:multicomponent Na+:H+ antiporter subunit G